jgi:hypothetical protein
MPNVSICPSFIGRKEDELRSNCCFYRVFHSRQAWSKQEILVLHSHSRGPWYGTIIAVVQHCSSLRILHLVWVGRPHVCQFQMVAICHATCSLAPTGVLKAGPTSSVMKTKINPYTRSSIQVRDLDEVSTIRTATNLSDKRLSSLDRRVAYHLPSSANFPAITIRDYNLR